MGDYSAVSFNNSEDLVNLAEYEDDEGCEVPGELARLLQQEEMAILPHEEPLEAINLGTEENRKEVQVGANLEPEVKERLVQLLNEYVEIFAWSYEDMPGLDTDIVVHRLPTRKDCPPIKQKVRRMRPAMSEKIKAPLKIFLISQHRNCRSVMFINGGNACRIEIITDHAF